MSDNLEKRTWPCGAYIIGESTLPDRCPVHGTFCGMSRREPTRGVANDPNPAPKDENAVIKRGDHLATRKMRAGDQPLPVINAGVCIQDLVIADIQARKAIGVQRYGTVLQPHNGRDALKDAYDEAVDLCQYLRQAIEERDHPKLA